MGHDVEPVAFDGVDNVGGNDFNAANGRTATLDVYRKADGPVRQIAVETRDTDGQDGPSVRPAVTADGKTVYVAYIRWTNFQQISPDKAKVTADIVVARDDHGALGPNAFTALKDPSDGLAGRLVASNVTIPWSNGPTLSQERVGSTLSMAVHPTNAQIAYVAWGDRSASDTYTLHVRGTHDGGATWQDLRTIHNATCAAVAVADSGTLGFLYQRLKNGRWETHVEQTGNDFATAPRDSVLATVPADAPPSQFLPYLGDYNFMLAMGNEFRGIFSANNTPDPADFPLGVPKYQRKHDFSTKRLLDENGERVAVSIDPFYFHVAVMQ